MTSTGHSGTVRFTLLELIVVLSLLTAAVALSVPHLGGFFRGRRLDHEARRLWALTCYARELAINRAVPVAVWVDSAKRQYGLEAVPGWGYQGRTFRYDISDGVEVQTEMPPGRTAGTAEKEAAQLIWWPDGSLADGTTRTVTLRETPDAAGAWRLVRNDRAGSFTLTREAAK